MKRTTLVTINGVVFHMLPSLSFALTIPYSYRYKSLRDCYDRPSKKKQEEYDKWVKWFIEMNASKYGIYSYNRYVFTMGGQIKWNGYMYYVYITPTRNELIPMEF